MALLAAVVPALVIVLLALPVHADDAAQLVTRGKDALMERDWAAGAAYFEAGLSLRPAATTRWQLLLGLALAKELSGELIDAAHTYRAFLSSARNHADAQGRWLERIDVATADLRRIESEILRTRARVDLQTSPPASVTLDGSPTEQTTPLVLYLEPGDHLIALVSPRHGSVDITLSVEPGQTPVIVRSLPPGQPAARAPPLAPAAPVTEPAVAAAAPAPPAPSDETHASAILLSGAILAGAGLTAIIAAALVTGSALADAGEIDRLQDGPVNRDTIARDGALRDHIANKQAAYISMYLAGALLGAVGAGLLIYEVQLVPSARGLQITGVF